VTPALVFDTGPLSHFAKQQWLGVLRAVVNDRDALIPDAVEVELLAGVGSHPHLQFVLDASWLQPVELVGEVELEAYAKFSRYLVVGERNRGEAAVLTLASINAGCLLEGEHHLPFLSGGFEKWASDNGLVG
jgi:hypothetical protein